MIKFGLTWRRITQNPLFLETLAMQVRLVEKCPNVATTSELLKFAGAEKKVC